jgi:hypothetical protein
MVARQIRWPHGGVSAHYYPRKRRLPVSPEELSRLVAGGDVVPISYTPPGVTDWRLGAFRFRQPRKTADPRGERHGEHVIEDLEELFQVLDEKGLEIYSVEGMDPDALHVGNSDSYRSARNPRGSRAALPHAPREAI